MNYRTPLLWAGLAAACVEAPPGQSQPAIEDILAQAPDTSLDAGCAESATQIAWTVEAHPQVVR